MFDESLLASRKKISYNTSKIEEIKYNESDVKKETNLVNELHKYLGDHLLRRRKKDVLKGLPEKKEILIHTDLTKKQRQIYKLIFMKNYEALKLLEKSSKNNMKISIKSATNILMYLRLCCNHPYLLSSTYNSGIKATDKLDQTEDVDSKNQQDLINSSGKLKILNKMLPKILAKGHKVLIFSQFKIMLNLLEDYFENQKIDFLRLDGDTPSYMRQRLIDAYNKEDSSYQIFLLSTRAGGLGINLHTADTIFIIDSDFNPHNDLQALSRAHRIGQKNRIMIYRLISKSTCEEKLMETAQHKLILGGLYIQRDKQAMALDTDLCTSDSKIEAKEMNQVLKCGANILFKDNDDDSYNDKDLSDTEIDNLLDRDKHFEEGKNDDSDDMDDYFSAFKVANIADKAVGRKQTGKPEPNNAQSEPVKSWEELMGQKVELVQKQQLDSFGKGKRNRKQVKYNDTHHKQSQSVSDEEYTEIETSPPSSQPLDPTSPTYDSSDSCASFKPATKTLFPTKSITSFLKTYRSKLFTYKQIHKGYTISELTKIRDLFPQTPPGPYTFPVLQSHSLPTNTPIPSPIPTTSTSPSSRLITLLLLSETHPSVYPPQSLLTYSLTHTDRLTISTHLYTHGTSLHPLYLPTWLSLHPSNPLLKPTWCIISYLCTLIDLILT